MSADFWAGYVSGAAGILVGNPLDLIKTRQQVAALNINTATPNFRNLANVLKGTAAPVFGYGALNAMLFVSYNRSEAAMNAYFGVSNSLWTTWMAGAIGGLAIWLVSTPTELIKCRAQLSMPPVSSWTISRQLWESRGIQGLYLGGKVTALRDSIGYGFYFWAYEALSRAWTAHSPANGALDQKSVLGEAPKILMCGGLAGIVTWASVFPLDVIKTRVQAQLLTSPLPTNEENSFLLRSPRHANKDKSSGAIQIARKAFREGGTRVFFAGLTVCSIRAFVVNAVQWIVYEQMMFDTENLRHRGQSDPSSVIL